MDETIKVPVLRGFLNGGVHVDVGDEIEVTLLRARALAVNGLVQLPDGETVNKNDPRPLTVGGGGGIVNAVGASTDGPAVDSEQTEDDTVETDAKDGKKKQEPANKKASDPKNKAD